jgi:ATP-dependent DNA helicase RecG
MFGKERTILNALPNYFVDFQELSADDPEIRWANRITIDGTWQPNVFNFRRRVYPLLVQGLRTPFTLDDEAVRQENTPIKEALREALANALTHADYRASGSISILMRKDAYIFQNPGRSLLPVPRILEALNKGRLESIPRNPNLQGMFRAVGWAERSGTGYPKIFRAWRGEQRLDPLILDDTERTTVTLPLLSLVPEAVEREVRAIVGSQYARLQDLDKLILLMAHQFGEISHTMVLDSRNEHPRVITERLTYLANEGWLSRHGTTGRGRTYRLGTPKEPDLIDAMGRVSTHKPPENGLGGPSSTHKAYQTGAMDIIALVKSSGRATPKQIETAILALCKDGFVSLAELSRELSRSPKTLRPHIQRLVSEKKLTLHLPDKPNSPAQAYHSIKGGATRTMYNVE